MFVIMSENDLQLLTRYASQRAEDAFAEIVRRHVDLVHSAALRQVRSPELAEEVAQAVFVELARRAGQLPSDTVVAAWLYNQTRHRAIDVVRREAGRRLREQTAQELQAMNATAEDWTHIEPLLDDAMDALEETDRMAVLLRYFQNKPLREVGEAIGVSDDAAQKRVSRAVEQLREFFLKRGINVGTSGLIVIISANAVQAGPTGLVITISTVAALAERTITTTAASVAAKTVAMTAFQKFLIISVFAALAGTGIYEANRASTLDRELKAIPQTQAPLASHFLDAQRERDAAVQQLNALRAENERLNRNDRELLRLRGEVGALRRELADAKQRATQPNTRNADSSWALGQVKTMGEWKDVGLNSPLAAVETFWSAAANNNIERMKQCLVFDRRTNAEPVSDIYAKRETQSNGGLVQSIGEAGVRLTSQSADWLDTDRTTIGVQVVGTRPYPDGSVLNVTQGEEFQLLRVNGEWKIIRDENRVKLSLWDDDSEAVAKMMLQMDSKAIEQVKADPRLPLRTLQAYERLKSTKQ